MFKNAFIALCVMFITSPSFAEICSTGEYLNNDTCTTCYNNAHVATWDTASGKDCDIDTCDNGYTTDARAKFYAYTTGSGVRYETEYFSGFTAQMWPSGTNYCGISGQNKWGVMFTDETVIRGDAKCSTTPANNYYEIGTPTGYGDYCWCRVTAIKSGDGTLHTTPNTPWMYNTLGHGVNCNQLCAKNCSITAEFNNVRNLYMSADVCIANNYNITYVLNGGAWTDGDSHPSNVSYDVVFEVNHPSRDGYTFTGWNITGMDTTTHNYGATNEVTTITTLSSLNDIDTLYFKNLRSTYDTVIFTAQWVQPSSQISCADNQYLDDDICKPCAIGTYSMAGDNVCTTNRYNIIFEHNGAAGSMESMMNLYYGTEYQLNQNLFTKDGYDFIGWCSNENWDEPYQQCNGVTTPDYTDEATVSNLTTNHDDTVIMHAMWNPIVYTITYNNVDSEDWVAPVNHPENYTVESGDIAIGAPIRDGYDFNGWCENSADCVAPLNPFEFNASNRHENIVLYAQWEEILPSCNAGEYLDDDTCKNCPVGTYSASGANTCTPCQNGTTTANTGASNCNVMCANNSNVKIWDNGVCEIAECNIGYTLSDELKRCIPTQYTINYVSNGGTEYADDTYTIESDTITLPTPTRDDYVFRGWYENPNFSDIPVTQIIKGSNGNKTFYAKWSDAEFVCDGVWMHVGEDKTCLSATRPSASPRIVVKIGNKKYYLNASIDEDLRINEDSNKKMHILYKSKTYNAHDNSVID